MIEFGPARVFIDGREIPVTDAEITIRHRLVNGSLQAPGGSCPECARVPLSGQAIVCEHGVTLWEIRG